MTMFAKRFNKFMRMRASGSNRRNNKRDQEEVGRKDSIVCYECKKSGHIKFNCPLLKRSNDRFHKKKAMVATWSDSDCSDDDSNEENANLCFMAIEDEKVIEHYHKAKTKEA